MCTGIPSLKSQEARQTELLRFLAFVVLMRCLEQRERFIYCGEGGYWKTAAETSTEWPQRLSMSMPLPENTEPSK